MRVVCFSEIQWRYLRTRKQQILSRFPPEWRILFLSSVVRGRRNNLRPERDGNVTHVCIPVLKNFPQRWVRVLFALAPLRWAWNVALYLWLRAILGAAGFGGRERVFYVSNIYYAPLLRFLPRALLLYDCNDDPLAFPGAPRWAEGCLRRLARMADVVVAVSPGLAARLEAAGASKTHIVGNGVDYELFERSAAGPVPAEMAALPRPVIGYVGAIAQWFDFDLVERIARAHPEAALALIGPVFVGVRERAERLRRDCPNVVFLGERPYEDLGAHIAAMDVCIVPLARSELRRLADPNKIYEYAAAGRPVVTLDYSPEIAALAGLIRVARTGEQFVAQVGEALREGADSRRLRAFARGRSWQAAAEQIQSLIEAGLAQRRANQREAKT